MIPDDEEGWGMGNGGGGECEQVLTLLRPPTLETETRKALSCVMRVRAYPQTSR